MSIINNIPFVLVILSTLIAWSVEVSSIYGLNYIPDSLALVIFFFLFGIGKLSIPVRMIISITPIILAFSLVILFNVYNDRLLTGGSGIIGITILTIIFVTFLNSYKSSGQIYLLEKQISIIFAFHIIYILIETLILISGGFDFLKLVIPSYRNLTGQPIYPLFGMGYPGGANGWQVGPQVASQILALSIIWFAPIYKKRLVTVRLMPNSFLWMLSLVLYPFCMSGTSLLMLFVMVCVLFVFPKKIFRAGFLPFKLSMILIIIFSVFTGSFMDIMAYRLYTSERYDYYFDIFLSPVISYLDLPLEKALFGMQQKYSVHNSSERIFTDFGMGAIVWIGGGLLALFPILTFVVIHMRVFFVSLSRRYNGSSDAILWLTLATASATSAIGWLVSLAHYTVAVETGGKQFFAFMIATTVVCLFRLNSMRLQCNLP